MCATVSPGDGASGTPALRGPLAALRRCVPLRVLGWLSVPFFPLFCLFVMDYMNYGGDRALLLRHWREFPGPTRFEILTVLFLFCVLTLVFRRAWLSGLIFGGLAMICAYVNYMKAALNGDNFYPQDLAMIFQARELASFISGGVPGGFWAGAAAAAVWILALWLLSVSLPRPFLWRWSAAALLVLAVHTATCTPARTKDFLGRFDMSGFDSALQSSNYYANGFVGAFAINVLSMRVSAPADYSRQAIEELLAPYPAVPADPDRERFDVVAVLSESFFDPRCLPGVSFSENPLTNYDRLLDDPGCFSGMVYTTALGGGTVRPEFALLTGLTTDYLPDVATPYWYVSGEVSTYVSNFKEAGYAALALHPYNAKFYSRDLAYPRLGFDAFYSEPDMYELTDVVKKRGHVSDQSTARVMEDLMDRQEGPAFLFTITMENHQPFDPLPEEEIRIRVDCPALSEPAHAALTTYTQGLYDADRMLGELARWIDGRERPTVLLFFGDHLPTLGANFLVYNETGFVNTGDGLTPVERRKLYATPFLIYSNRELDGGLLGGRTGNEISDYNLLNSVTRSIGLSRTPYMELLADFHAAVPYYNVRLELPADGGGFTRAMRLITYDRILGRGWSG